MGDLVYRSTLSIRCRPPLYGIRIVQSALFCAIGHFAQMNSAKTVCATLVHTIQLHNALLLTGCTIIPDAQTNGMHNHTESTNPWEAQSDRMHKTMGSTIRKDAQIYRMHNHTGCTNLQNAQSYRMHKPMGCTIIPDAQTHGMHNHTGCTNLWNAQSYRMHKPMGCTTIRDAPAYQMYKPMGCTNLRDAHMGWMQIHIGYVFGKYVYSDRNSLILDSPSLCLARFAPSTI